MEDILRVIGSIARELDSIANVEFKEINLTKGQFLYLARVCENPGIIQGELAELLRVDRTTAARALRKLEDQGLISRQFTAGNQKIKRLYPTEKGRSVYPIIKRENEYSNATALQGLSEEEVKQVRNLLLRVEKNVNADWHYVKNGNHRDY
ncbi:MarR family winged helix-turn-helix transcriptional regulator [Pediococcus acidilactici]|jgi:DNA-binding MarR family transcriptional regulator|uniref:MarR family winged helix-turn-helix transcriptional regulator n=1 Tax=Pediococcus acidilactici TaxID=1254 RepID=UPI000FEDD120|nr:MarR family transcriptional regulator [Pediococcus acidilactici]KAF0340543.1 MarR family transcriptional regulator [Pediococcus acidilactici]KAF0352463.1 MarR family transcriptional regulator [Pediococcus acidilactici]KAF0356298.1 MarR family transcriptional regulator [Pediococcus acidilactici]KAF0360915.1 MarR family transcriptional regulator [Pediococcus acidilactici]KAF0374491.1 MarR family transcriptional regulator [Pediococcus acidilactici]